MARSNTQVAKQEAEAEAFAKPAAVRLGQAVSKAAQASADNAVLLVQAARISWQGERDIRINKRAQALNALKREYGLA